MVKKGKKVIKATAKKKVMMRKVVKKPMHKTVSVKKSSRTKKDSVTKNAKSLAVRNKVQTAVSWKRAMMKKMK
jgi:hypothetical protein